MIVFTMTISTTSRSMSPLSSGSAASTPSGSSHRLHAQVGDRVAGVDERRGRRGRAGSTPAPRCRAPPCRRRGPAARAGRGPRSPAPRRRRRRRCGRGPVWCTRSSPARTSGTKAGVADGHHTTVVEGPAAHEAQSVGVPSRPARGRDATAPSVCSAGRPPARRRRLDVGVVGSVGRRRRPSSATGSVSASTSSSAAATGSAAVDLAGHDRLPRRVGERDREAPEDDLVGVLGDRQHDAVAGALRRACW